MKCFFSVFVVLIVESGPDTLAVVGVPVLPTEGGRCRRALSGVCTGEAGQPHVPCPSAAVLTCRLGIFRLPCLLELPRLPPLPVPAALLPGHSLPRLSLLA